MHARVIAVLCTPIVEQVLLTEFDESVTLINSFLEDPCNPCNPCESVRSVRVRAGPCGSVRVRAGPCEPCESVCFVQVHASPCQSVRVRAIRA